MSAREVLASAFAAGVSLRRDGDKLIVSWPKGHRPPESLRDELRAEKAALQ